MLPRRRQLADPFYYLRNFERVLAVLDARYGALWSAEERRFVTGFATLPRASRALLVRMAIRAGDLFRAGDLVYAEIGDVGSALAPLLACGWAGQVTALPIARLIPVFTKEELLSYFAAPGASRRAGKPALAAILRAQHPAPVSLVPWSCTTGELLYELRVAGLCDQLRAMYFGNFHQDWTEFVRTELGVLSYEAVPASLQAAAFRTRVEIDSFRQLQRVFEGLAAEEAPVIMEAALPPRVAGCDWLEDLREEMLFRIARAHGTRGDATGALRCYSLCRHRGARIRTARLQERAKDWDSARRVCLAALDSPESAAERHDAQKILARVGRKLGITSASLPPAQPSVPSFDLVAEARPPGYAVEHYARERLIAEAAGDVIVRYVENSLVTSLFGLLCWRAVFEPLPGAFFHDYQSAPADLASSRFYERRRDRFAECFAQLETGEYVETIWRCYAAKAGMQSPFVAWRTLSKRLLELALGCFPAAHLRLWFEWIVADVRTNCAGFPDLVQFWPRERRYRLIEVKGPGDRLQDNQRRLLEFCALHHMPVAVCYVRIREEQS